MGKSIKKHTPKTSKSSSIPSVTAKKTNINTMTSSNNTTEFDLSIFKHENNECTNLVKCTSISRLIASLKYHSMLDIVNNTKHQEIFAHFINNIYSQQLLSDYTHLVTKHGQDLEDIHSSITKN